MLTNLDSSRVQICTRQNKRQLTTAITNSTKTTRIVTFNVHGLSAAEKKIDLARDINKYRVDICCLQETKVSALCDETIQNVKVILLPCKCRHYGLGFAINSRLAKRLISYKSVNDRIATATFKLSGRSTLKIINVYGPTLDKASKSPDERDRLYEQLDTELSKLGEGTSFFIAGDFNSKIGLRTSDSTCVGNFGRGRRNENGEHLLDFCEAYDLLATSQNNMGRSTKRSKDRCYRPDLQHDRLHSSA